MRKTGCGLCIRGLGELMESTGNGHLAVPVGDAQGLADKVAMLLSDPDALKNIGIHNEAAARALYGIEAYQWRLDQIISQWREYHPHWLTAGNRAPSWWRDPRYKRSPRLTRHRPPQSAEVQSKKILLYTDYPQKEVEEAREKATKIRARKNLPKIEEQEA